MRGGRGQRTEDQQVRHMPPRQPQPTSGTTGRRKRTNRNMPPHPHTNPPWAIPPPGTPRDTIRTRPTRIPDIRHGAMDLPLHHAPIPTPHPSLYIHPIHAATPTNANQCRTPEERIPYPPDIRPPRDPSPTPNSPTPNIAHTHPATGRGAIGKGGPRGQHQRESHNNDQSAKTDGHPRVAAARRGSLSRFRELPFQLGPDCSGGSTVSPPPGFDLEVTQSIDRLWPTPRLPDDNTPSGKSED